MTLCISNTPVAAQARYEDGVEPSQTYGEQIYAEAWAIWMREEYAKRLRAFRPGGPRRFVNVRFSDGSLRQFFGLEEVSTATRLSESAVFNAVKRRVIRCYKRRGKTVSGLAFWYVGAEEPHEQNRPSTAPVQDIRAPQDVSMHSMPTVEVNTFVLPAVAKPEAEPVRLSA